MVVIKNARNSPSHGEKSEREVSVCFLPFWEPYLNHASSRLRGLFPAKFLAEAPHVLSTVGWVDGADLYFVIQLCSDPTLERLRTIAKDAVIAYVVCDKQFESGSSIGGVTRKHRFAEICDIADLFIVPTEILKSILEARFPGRPVFVIPDTQDYVDLSDSKRVPTSNVVAWFGNPGKGNFESARPYLDYCVAKGFDLRIISKQSYFKKRRAYRRYVVQWSYDTFISNLRSASFCIISFDSDQSGKSANRLVTSVMNGVPALVSGRSSTSAEVLIENGLGWAVVGNSEELASAIKKIQDEEWRAIYIYTMQAYFRKEVGAEVIRHRYISLIRTLFQDRTTTRKGGQTGTFSVSTKLVF